MASRRDQLHSYQFLVQRVISALVMRETDPAESPLRRGVGAVFGGLMVTIIVAAGFGLYGLVTKIGSTRWRVDGSVVVENETGAVYLYRDGALHPMQNYASAVLASGRIPPTSTHVPRRSLQGIRKGVMLGIPNAPNSLPPERDAVTAPWSLCAAPTADDGAVTTILIIARGPTGDPRALGEQEGLVVRAATGDRATYLIWHGHRFPVRQPDKVLPPLFGADVPTLTVGPAWLNGLPQGASIGTITVKNQGADSTVLPGRRTGDLLVAQTGAGPSYYLLLDDGVAPITELQKAIMAGQSAVQPATVSVGEVNNAKKSGQLSSAEGDSAPPRAAPRLVRPALRADPVCLTSADPRSPPHVLIGGSLRGLGTGTPTGAAGANGTVLADSVNLEPGRVAVVRVLPAPGATGALYAVVTDIGVRYPVVSEAALGMLGYRAASAVEVPVSLVKLIPVGPTLDPARATRPVETATRSGS
jgi:type VII secretion protein EccB